MDRYNNYGTSAKTPNTSKSGSGIFYSLLEKAISSINGILPNKRTFTRSDGTDSWMNLSMSGGQPRKIKIMAFFDPEDDTSCAIYDDSSVYVRNGTEVQGGGNYCLEEESDAPSTSMENIIYNAQQYVKDVKAMISGTPSSNLVIEGCPMSDAAYNRML
ncbi:hypothetical protein [Candidatus Anaplasma sp. TIGMIC]|uniref:hypothetical protein n=1 Tax=Candidatus Anaplasma sp. TIGMIC TaxID=3020713 RepID=UPI00232A9B7D|nr:hypothetical protein [Candidatus Anaplasma sp. TIGMIC]MDB1135408.1 hypothetical protein [Candidatus Anaplasma sp. TIGMIC]